MVNFEKKLIVWFTDGDTSEGRFIFLLSHTGRIGAVNSIESFIEYTKNATHIAVTEEYGNTDKIIKVYPLAQVLHFKEVMT